MLPSSFFSDAFLVSPYKHPLVYSFMSPFSSSQVMVGGGSFLFLGGVYISRLLTSLSRFTSLLAILLLDINVTRS